jgi:hypothetical protein
MRENEGKLKEGIVKNKLMSMEVITDTGVTMDSFTSATLAMTMVTMMLLETTTTLEELQVVEVVDVLLMEMDVEVMGEAVAAMEAAAEVVVEDVVVAGVVVAE